MRIGYVLAAVTCFGLSAAAADAAVVQWDTATGGNGHYYEFDLTQYASFAEAVAAAAAHTYNGMTGYLATINTAEEQQFLDTLNPGYAITAWLGGSDAASEGDWQWVTEPGGPTPVTYTNWAQYEPNNAGEDGENGLLGWWNFGEKWNDISDTYGSFALLVEYSPVSEVPLPAGLPLLLAGLGGLALLRRRNV